MTKRFEKSFLKCDYDAYLDASYLAVLHTLDDETLCI